MPFVTDPIELATGITDAILALLALACGLGLLVYQPRDPWKARLWAAAYALLAVASALGVLQHGIQVSSGTQDLAIHAVNLFAGMTVALFVTGAIRDRWGAAAGRRALPIMLLIGLVFFAISVPFTQTFLVFIGYEAAAMLLALVLYGSLIPAGAPGAGLMTIGIVVNIIAAVVQVSSLSVDVIWQLDHNSLFHVVQMLGVLILFAGLRASLAAVGAPAATHVASRTANS